MDIMDKVKLKGLKAFLPMIESGIEGFIPDIKADKSKFQLTGLECDLIALLQLHNDKIMVMLVTITTDNKINRVLWRKPISEALALISSKI